MIQKEENIVLDKITEGLKIYNERLIKTKKARNLDVVVSQNGKVVRIKAKDL